MFVVAAVILTKGDDDIDEGANVPAAAVVKALDVRETTLNGLLEFSTTDDSCCLTVAAAVETNENPNADADVDVALLLVFDNNERGAVEVALKGLV